MNPPAIKLSPYRPTLQLLLSGQFMALIFLSSILVGVISHNSTRQAITDMAFEQQSQAAFSVLEHVQGYLDLPHRLHHITAASISQGLLDSTDPKALQTHLRLQLQSFPEVTSLYFGNPDGGLVNAGREGPEGNLYVIQTENFMAGTFNKYALDDQGRPAEILASIPDFDARTRTWYRRAFEAQGPVWSDIYVLFTGQELALAASRPVYDSNGHLLGVAAGDQFLSQISNYLQRVPVSENGKSFIMERSGMLVATSQNESLLVASKTEGSFQRLAATASPSVPIRQAAHFLLHSYGDYTQIAAPRHTRLSLENETFFLYVAPLQDAIGIDWLVVMLVPEDDFMNVVQAGFRTTILLMILAALLSGLLGLLTAHWIIGPLKRLTSRVNEMARQQWPEAIPAASPQEVSQLAQAFNDMVQRLKRAISDLQLEIAARQETEKARLEAEKASRQLQQQLQQAQKMEAIGTLAGGIAHDFNNLLQAIGGYAQLLLMQTSASDSSAPTLAKIQQAVDRAAQLIRQLLTFSRKLENQRQPLDLNAEIINICDMLSRTLARTVVIQKHLASGLPPILADAVQIEQLLMNLAINAADAMPQGGLLTISTRRFDVGPDNYQEYIETAPGSYVQLTVTDTGQGIPDEIQHQIFDPFFTTKAVGKGTGLGLASVYGIVKSYGGHIRCSSQPGQGTCFEILLPVGNSASEQSRPAMTSAPLASQGQTLLVVDDEGAIRELAAEVLTQAGYQVLTAANGREALTAYQQATADSNLPALVILDLGMPEMDGRECLRALRKLNSDVQVLVASGYLLDDEDRELLETCRAELISKPYQLRDLLRRVQELLSAKSDEPEV